MSYNYDDLSVSEAKDLLRKWRENNERRSEEVLELFHDVIGDNLHKLGNEQHVIMEQVFYAALDCHNSNASYCLSMLYQEFPGSLRVMKLTAAELEAEEKYDEALEILDYIIKTDETNSAARKRRVAIFKAQGLINEAIKELVDYLRKFMSDVEAWQELCELYLEVQEYTRAVFCAEELLLHQPHNHLFYQRVADIRYTMGGVDNMELAKTYYSHALKLNPDNMRAILGLVLVTNNLLTHYKSSGNGNKRKDIWKLSQWAMSSASKKHKEAGSNLTQMMLSLAITE